MEIDNALTIIMESMPKNTKRALVGRWKKWRACLGGKVKGIEGSLEVRMFLNQEIKSGVAQSTIAYDMEILKATYDKLLDMEVVKKNPFRQIANDVKKGSRGLIRPTKLTPFESVQKLFAIAEDKEDLAMLAFLYGGGRRIGEMENILKKDIQFTNQKHIFIKLKNTKGAKDIDAVIPDWCARYILDLARDCKENEKVFKYSYKTHYRRFKKLAARIGLDVAPHSGRATAITYLLDKGCDYQQVKCFSGHASVRMVEWYDKRRFEKDSSPALILNY